MIKGAILSGDQTYRYQLWRKWDETKPMVAIVGLNPSTADDKVDDPTILRCIDFVKRWEFGGFYMVNLFAYRATNPMELYKVENAVGEDNDCHLREVFAKVGKVICAWGNHGSLRKRSEAVLRLIQDPYCLKVNKCGEPAHPLYLRKDLPLLRYKLGMESFQESGTIAKT